METVVSQVITTSDNECVEQFFCGVCQCIDTQLREVRDGETLEDVHFWIECDVCETWFHGTYVLTHMSSSL